MATVRLFEYAAHAHIYSKYRPTYPIAVVEAITSYVTRLGGSLGHALDVACGSGQSTFYLKDTFKLITGVDISKAQLEEAKSKCQKENIDNIQFLTGSGMELPVESESVDVVTIAQALHWLDIDKFFTECKRVLKPRGCVAVYGYGNVCLINKQCNELVSNFYSNTLQGCWHDARHHIDEEYRSIHMPFSNTQRIDTSMPYETSLDAFIGYVSTWSGYQKYCEDHPKNTVLEDMKATMREILESGNQMKQHLASKECEGKPSSVDSNDSSIQLQQGRGCENIKLEAYFPLFILLGQKT